MQKITLNSVPLTPNSIIKNNKLTDDQANQQQPQERQQLMDESNKNAQTLDGFCSQLKLLHDTNDFGQDNMQ